MEGNRVNESDRRWAEEDMEEDRLKELI